MAMTDEQLLADLCRQVGVGMGAVQGTGRDPVTVAARRIIAKCLREKAGWTIPRVARVLHKTDRAVVKMSAK